MWPSYNVLPGGCTWLQWIFDPIRKFQCPLGFVMMSFHILCYHAFIFLHCNLWRFDNLIQLGERLGVSPRVSGEVMDKVKMLVQEKDALNEAASLRSKQLHQCHQLQLFYKDAEQVDTTTANQEAFLTNEDLGVGVIAWSKIRRCGSMIWWVWFHYLMGVVRWFGGVCGTLCV